MGFIESQLSESRDREFIGRMHRMRTLGLGVGMLPIASVLYANDASAWAWALLLFNGLAWPHVQWWLARRSHDQRGAECPNLILASAAGAARIAVLPFNLLPHTLLVTQLTAAKFALARWRFPARPLQPSLPTAPRVVD